MHFDFSAPIKKTKQQNQVKLKLYEVVTKDICCVAGINLDGTYHAINIATGEDYLLTSRSYHLNTKTYYAQQIVSDNRIKIYSLQKHKHFNTPWLYLPFAPGVGMMGNLVKSKVSNNEVILFDLQRTFDMPIGHPLAKTEFLYFRDNYDIIYNNIIKKYEK